MNKSLDQRDDDSTRRTAREGAGTEGFTREDEVNHSEEGYSIEQNSTSGSVEIRTDQVTYKEPKGTGSVQPAGEPKDKVETDISPQLYGVSKPKRRVIRGRIVYDRD